MIIKEIEAHSASDTVVKQILANIAAGELQPGDRLPTQEQLGEMFGVGRSSTREATNALAIMGYLEITQGRGTFIKSTTPTVATAENSASMFGKNADLMNLLDIREILECHAIRQAAERASDHQLEGLNKAAARLEECRQDVGSFLPADLDFHLAIAAAADNPELGEIVRHVHNATNSRVPVAFTTSKIENIQKAIDTAQQMHLFIMMGEAGQATRCLRNHLAISREALVKATGQPLPRLV